MLNKNGCHLNINKNKEISFDLKYNPFFREYVVFSLKPQSYGTTVTCVRTSRGLFSFLSLWGFSNTKSKILENLGYFIPEETPKEETLCHFSGYIMYISPYISSSTISSLFIDPLLLLRELLLLWETPVVYNCIASSRSLYFDPTFTDLARPDISSFAVF